MNESTGDDHANLETQEGNGTYRVVPYRHLQRRQGQDIPAADPLGGTVSGLAGIRNRGMGEGPC